MLKIKIDEMYKKILIPIMLIALLPGVTSCGKNTAGKSTDKIENSESEKDSISNVEELVELSNDSASVAIVAKVDNKTIYVDKENYERITSELKQRIHGDGVLVTNASGAKFILYPHDVPLRYDRNGKGLGGDYIAGREDFDQLPTKEEAEMIKDNFEDIQTLLKLGGMSPLEGKYWTKTKVHDEYENVLSYGSYWIYGKGREGKPYVVTQQTINVGHLRLVRRINSGENRSLTSSSDNSNSSADEIFTGSIGPYPIRMWYNFTDTNVDGLGMFSEVAGKYEYTKNGTVLEFTGSEDREGNIELNERTNKGKETGKFELKRDLESDELTGTFTNLQNGKQYDVKLRSSRSS